MSNPRGPLWGKCSLTARYGQAETLPAGTPWHRLALVIQPASRTTPRLSLVIGMGVSKIELSVLLPGDVNGLAPAILSTVVALHSCRADSPALLPSCRASFQTSTV